MRLIDADKLLNDMKRNCIGNCDRCDEHTILSSDLHCGLVDRQPTIQPQGIDKDRLIEELKEESKFALYEMEEPKIYAGIETAIEVVNQQPTSDGWIPCSVAVPANAVPDECDDILIKRVTGEIIRGWYWSGSGRWWTKENGIGHEVRNAIAWMPYKESE